MRAGSRKFVVEVKRGTNRSAFATPDPAASRFREAEALLFGAASAPDVEAEPPKDDKPGPAGGRILRSLVEPPPPSFEEMFPPVRRGRKPGSKNKPKDPVLDGASAGQPAERPRRGRKPGSKNRPKVPILEVAAPFDGRAATAAAMRSYGFPEEEAELPVGAAPEAAPAPRAADAPATSPGRLRERSSVLRRYVLGIEPHPGQPGALRARRLARAAR